MKTIEIKVESYKILEKNESVNLTWIQKLVCKWFKITPKPNVFYKIEVDVKLDASTRLMVGDYVLSAMGDRFMVTGITQNGNLILDSLYNINFEGLGGGLVNLGRPYAEEGSEIK